MTDGPALAPAQRRAEESIDPDWRISDVLDRYPALLETLAGLYPGFNRLRNPVLRALRAPRISVAQAARVAGMGPAELCRALNAAAGLPEDAARDAPEERAVAPTSPTPPPTGMALALELDVSGLPPPEPMVKILEALETLAPGGALHVRHSRVPIYLYPRLDAMGYTHETREVGAERVELTIRKPGAAAR
ncbi:MAG TPA: DUF2249 domain-containing protein [Chloroflexota bacterium]|nr:DUF2249 domain-containing protein [Chloroflexota bacterium]